MVDGQEVRILGRHQMAAIILIAIMIVVSVYSIYRLVKSNPTFNDIVICDNCEHIFEKVHSGDEMPPFVCENCGEKKAYICYRCDNCKRHFPDLNPHIEGTAECPYCLSRNVNKLLYVPIKVPETKQTE